MDDGALALLQMTREYAQKVTRTIELDPGRSDLAPLARAYIAGVLMTLHRVGLVTDSERDEWSQIFDSDLPR